MFEKKNMPLLCPGSSSGSALVWVMVITSAVCLLCSTMLALSASRHAGSIHEKQRTQAYLEARSTAELLAGEFTKPGNDSQIKDALLMLVKESDGNEELVEWPEGLETNLPGGGGCTIVLSYTPSTRILAITATAGEEGARESVTAFLKNVPTGQITGEFEGIRAEMWDAWNLVSMIQDGPFDVWISGDGETDLARETAVTEAGAPGTISCLGSMIQSTAVIGEGGPVLGSLLSGEGIYLDHVDNSFVLRPSNNVYSLYAYNSEADADGGACGEISLTGNIIVENSQKKDCVMVSPVIHLKGPDMEVHGSVEGRDLVTVEQGVWIDGSLSSDGEALLEGTAEKEIVIGSQDKDSSIKAGRVIINGGEPENDGNSEAAVTIWGTIESAGISLENKDEEPAVIITGYQPVEIHGDIVSSKTVVLAGDVSVYGTIWADEIIITSAGDSAGIPRVYGEEPSEDERKERLQNLKNQETVIYPLTLDGEWPDLGLLDGSSPELVEAGEVNLSNEGELVYQITASEEEEEMEYQRTVVSAIGNGESYLVTVEDLVLSSFYGGAGERGSANASLVIYPGACVSVEEELSGFVYGEGILDLKDNSSMTGMCNIGTLLTGEGVSLRVVPKNPDQNAMFSEKWTITGYQQKSNLSSPLSESKGDF